MSRHRNIRTYHYSEDYEDDNDIYGRSVEEEINISPSEESFLYDRNHTQQNMSSFFDTATAVTIPENCAIQCQSDADPVANEEPAFQKSEREFRSIDDQALEEKASVSNSTEKKVQIVHSSGSSVTEGFVVSQITADNKESRQYDDTLSSNASHHQEKTVVDDKKPPLEKDDENLNPRVKYGEDVVDVISKFKKDRCGSKENLYLIVIGHVDAGKSTLMGHLLHKLGYVNQRLMHKYEHETKKAGKQSFLYAWILDEIGEERNRGITIDVARNKFETSKRDVTLLDAPGHKDFIPNMLTGVTQADVALLVVDATSGEFETGFESGGQTREHTLIVRSLGISQLGVAVNKMDNVNWSQERFNEIRKKLSTFLRQAGFKDNDITYAPCSGLTGENLVEETTEPALKAWYSGPTLVDLIDSFKTPKRSLDKPFRMCVNDIFKGTGTIPCLSGRVETGFVSAGKKVLVQPQGEVATIKALLVNEVNESSAYAGDFVYATLVNYDPENVFVGSVLCDIEKPIRVTTKFEAKIVLFNIIAPITKGYTVILHLHSLTDSVIIAKLNSQVHRVTGELIKRRPRCLLKNTAAIITVESSRPICVELYENIREYGRFMLRDTGVTIAAGLITKIF